MRVISKLHNVANSTTMKNQKYLVGTSIILVLSGFHCITLSKLFEKEPSEEFGYFPMYMATKTLRVANSGNLQPTSSQ